ncbi:MAG: hypothetical protein J7525_14090 [Roseofilum sp. SID3]|uniref:hypothetical protein n=1 Tax=Roseofilum sp. SID3 TaxID=2821499 RepID=UPI001B2F3C1A|nr:hypothetical protein [Roseofilum sp. SID3]MBP0014223.1 hypothetical protein [Roseofilum sp. SID3]
MNYLIGKVSASLFVVLLLTATLLDMGHTFDSRHGFYRQLPQFPGILYVIMSSSAPLILAFSFGINTGAGVPDALNSENEALRAQLRSHRQHYKEVGKL